MESASKYGLKQYRVTIRVRNYGHSALLMKMIGKNGGKSLMMELDLGTCIS